MFSRSEPQVFAFYKKFIEVVEEVCGEVRIIPQKTRVAIQARVRFTGCVPRKSYLQCGFWFTGKHENPRFWKIEFIPPNCFAHYVRIRSEEEFDDEFRSWIGEAHEVGLQRHLGKLEFSSLQEPEIS